MTGICLSFYSDGICFDTGINRPESLNRNREGKNGENGAPDRANLEAPQRGGSGADLNC